MKSPRTLILAYGNPLRRDDGIGWQVAQRLQQQDSVEGLVVHYDHQLLPEHAELISGFDRCVLVDACEQDLTVPYQITQIKPERVDPASFTHHYSPSSLLGYCLVLYGCQPEMWLVTVQGNDFGFGEGLSPAVAQVLPVLVGEIISLIQ